MNVIHKYRIPGAGAGPIEMPEGAVVLCAREQHNEPCIWALVDPGAKRVQRHFLAAETSNIAIPDNSRYLGTCMLHGGHYVLHVFEPAQITN